MVTVYILAYKGNRFIDKLIQWYEWGKYGHVMLAYHINPIIRQTYIYEDAGTPVMPHKNLKSGARKGFIKDLHPKYRAKDIDIFSIAVKDEQYVKIRNWVDTQINNKVKYDYLDFLGFILRNKDFDDPHKFVCSTFVFEAFKKAGITLLNIPTYKVTPTLLCASPLLNKYFLKEEL